MRYTFLAVVAVISVVAIGVDIRAWPRLPTPWDTGDYTSHNLLA